MASASFLWAKVLSYIEKKYSASIVVTLFDDIDVVDFTDNQLVLYTSNEFRVRLDFELLQQYKKELEAYFDSSFDTLSMGMSDDYPLALDYGTTMVRIGALIIGKRDYAAADKEATV